MLKKNNFFFFWIVIRRKWWCPGCNVYVIIHFEKVNVLIYLMIIIYIYKCCDMIYMMYANWEAPITQCPHFWIVRTITYLILFDVDPTQISFQIYIYILLGQQILLPNFSHKYVPRAFYTLYFQIRKIKSLFWHPSLTKILIIIEKKKIKCLT